MGCIIKRILTITMPVKYRPIQLWDEAGNDITKSSLYSWSTDSICWTNWVDLNTYSSIGPNIEGDYYLRILLMGGFGKLAYDNSYIDCYNICLYNQNPYVQDLCSGNTLDIYSNLDCAIQMQQQLSDLVCCTFGIPCYYFRVTPDVDTKDLTFKEYVLHNVSDMKYIKILCQDGQLPSSKPQMTEFDFDWDNDWEVECSKTAFATAFGDTAFPKQRDIIYVPLMKRLYEVNAAYDEKQDGLMWRASTWKLALVKWAEKTNVNQNAFEDIIDNFAVNQIMDFLPSERNEQDRESATTQSKGPLFIANNLTDIFMQDAIRKSISANEIHNIMEMQLNHASVQLAKNAYCFLMEDSGVLYQKSWCGDSGTLMMLIEYNKPQNNKPLFTAGNIILNLNDNGVEFDGMSCELNAGEAYILICKWDRPTFSQSLNIYKYKCTAPKGIPLYKIKPEMYRFDFENPVCELTKAYNNDYITSCGEQISLYPAPCKVTNIKLYNIALDNESGMYRESLKYMTSNENCILNDVARPIESQYGYNIR